RSRSRATRSARSSSGSTGTSSTSARSSRRRSSPRPAVAALGRASATGRAAARGGGGPRRRGSKEPVGLVAHVSAWNYPYFVGLNSIVPALLAGNAVAYKPSEHATLTGLRLVEQLHRAGVPVDVVHAVVGGGATGAALVDADVDMVCFTGSYAT